MSTMVTRPVSPPETSKIAGPHSPRHFEWLKRSDSNDKDVLPPSRPSTGTIHGIRRIASDGHTWTKKFHVTVESMEAQGAKDQDPKNSNQEHHGTTIPEAQSALVHDSMSHPSVDRGDSMRAALKQPPRGERSVSRGRTHVDQSIEATVKKPETSGTARSRKASHMMGIFDPRSGTSTPVPALAEQVHRTGGSKEPFGFSKSSFRPTTPLTQDVSPGHSIHHASRDYFDATVHKSADPNFQAAHQDAVAVSSLKPDHDPYFRHQDLAQAPHVPSKLLEEIRGAYKRKTLGDTPPRKSIPGTATEPSPPFGAVDFRRSGQREDEEEHISAAVYYPHPGPSPEEIEQFASPGEVFSDLHNNRLPRTPAVDTLLSSDKAVDVARTSEHIDISVVSQNDKKIFHGDYHPSEEASTDLATPPLSPVEEAPASAFVSTSESEMESGDELVQQSQTDDMSTTPTQQNIIARRPSKVQAPHTRAKVVLEPYRHQVGGHSTMFRFSRRAVCKQLNNRENEFYERIEQRHPDMLKFLPRSVLTLFQLACVFDMTGWSSCR